jgi:putative ABC transport system permease protein
MLKSYLKTAWRNTLRNRGYSLLNIMGLSTGMAVALLIGMWVYKEYTYDKFLPGYKQVYQVRRNFNSNGEILNFTTVSLKLADALRSQVPEMESVVESGGWWDRHLLMVGDKKLVMTGALMGSDFLNTFQFPLVQGNEKAALKDPFSIVLTASTAKALFGNENPMGRILRVDDKNNVKVTGILSDIPANSTLQFQYVLPFSYLESVNPDVKTYRDNSFGDNIYSIFVKLKKNISEKQIALRIKDIEKSEKGNTNAMLSEVILQPLDHIHLYGNYQNGRETGGFLEYVEMFGLIGILVLVIACINFVNLTTAHSEKRAREVGVRKVMGGARKDLIFQFLTESVILTFIAFFFSVLLVAIVLPSFNQLTYSRMQIPYDNVLFWSITMALVFITAILAGSRPAFFLSGFQPVKVLKGMKAGKSAALPRKILVILQFSCSVALIISTAVIYNQIRYAQNRPTGFQADRLLITWTNEQLRQNYRVIKNELQAGGLTDGVTLATSPATNVYWHSDVDQWPGKNPGETIEMGTIMVSEDYFKTLGMVLLEGRDFTSAADSNDVVLNEMAVKQMRLKNPLGQSLIFQGHKVRVIGIAKNALMLSPFSAADPTLFWYNPDPLSVMMYRISPGVKTANAVAGIGKIFAKYDPLHPFDYQFAEAGYAEKFSLEVLVGKLSGIFSLLAVFISCLGLFGLAAFTAQQRTKEIGIRKVLGASVSQVWFLLSKDFVLLVIISCLIASPIAYYYLHNWLQKYEYRVDIGSGVFFAAAVSAILITLITISFQAIRAALANPVDSLKTE